MLEHPCCKHRSRFVLHLHQTEDFEVSAVENSVQVSVPEAAALAFEEQAVVHDHVSASPQFRADTFQFPDQGLSFPVPQTDSSENSEEVRKVAQVAAQGTFQRHRAVD